MLVDMLMLAVIGRGDFGQKSGDHLNDIGNRHCAYLILLSNLLFTA